MILRTEELYKNYPARAGAESVEVLRGVNLEIMDGSVTAIVGASGSGKSTLMHILGGLDKPSKGNVYFKDKNLATFDDEQLSVYRNRHVGFVFQFHHLLPEFTALENVMMPAIIRNHSTKEIQVEALKLLERFGLGDRTLHRPSMLSGGEQQRVAMARALINKPSVLLADEPTGNLDEHNSGDLIQLILGLRDEYNLTIVMVTHDSGIASLCDVTLTLKNGTIY